MAVASVEERELLKTISWNAPVTIDNPSRCDGIVDAGKQAYQLVEILGIETRLFGRRKRCSIFDHLDLVGTILIYQTPQGDRLPEELPSILELVDDLGVFKRSSHWIRPECV